MLLISLPGFHDAGRKCRGVFILVTDRQALRPVRLGLEVAAILYHLYPTKYRLEEEENLAGSESTLIQVLAGENPAAIVKTWQADEKHWRQLRRPYFLYPE